MKKLLITLLLILTLGACGSTEEPPVEKDVNLTDIYFEIEIANEVSYGYELPQTVDGIDITWQSNISGIIDANQLTDYMYTTDITLTASFSHEEKTMTKTFNVTFNGQVSLSVEELLLQEAETALTQMYQNTVLDDDIVLPTEIENVTLDWNISSNYITNNGTVTRPTFNEGDQTVTFTVTFTYNNQQSTSTIDFTITALDQSVVYTGYYEGLDGLLGEALRTFLHNLIDDHTILTYDEVKYAIRDTDEDPLNSNNVILFYTGRSQAKTTFGGGADDFNREHVWAKSHGDFGNDMGPGTDLHHIRPTDASVNSTRGSLDFDEGGSEVYDQGVATGNFKDSDSWEPRDEVKGDVARMMFYMAIRYEGDDGYVDLELNYQVNNGSAPYIGDLEMLLKWHLEDPVDEFEMNRNDVIYSYQGNRNPFIDHPELVELIWGTSN